MSTILCRSGKERWKEEGEGEIHVMSDRRNIVMREGERTGGRGGGRQRWWEIETGEKEA